MSIDRTTYESYAMDYLDGNLDALQVSELLLFLEQNPDLKEEFEGMRDFTLDKTTGEVPFDNSSLKKPGYEEVKHLYEPMIVAGMEGDASASDLRKLEEASRIYPGLLTDKQLFLRTRLEPDMAVVYQNKRQLKVFTLQSYYKPVLRIAAVLLCVSLLGAYFYRMDGTAPQTARVETTTTTGTAPEQHTQQRPLVAANDRVPEKPVVPQGIKPTGETAHPARKKNAVKETGLLVKQERSVAVPVAGQITRELPAVPLPALAGQNSIAYRVQKPSAPAEPEFVDFKTWVARKVKKGASLEEDQTLLSKINELTHADIVLEKDTAGKVTRFEIAGLGFSVK